MSEIITVDAWEGLDSRGHPTVRVGVETKRASARFTVPAGASTGSHEALEWRDGDPRYGGLGVRDAIEAIQTELAHVAVGREVTNQQTIDAELVATDGTDGLSRIGANAVLDVSGAVARVASADSGAALYESLGPSGVGRLPLPMVNVVSGGLHAEGGIEVQDFLALPVGADRYPEALRTAWAVRQAVRDRILDAGYRPLVADEGFPPPLDVVDDGFSLLERGIADAGFEPGRDVAIGVDVAASHFYDEETDTYRLESLGQNLTRDRIVALVEEWVETYPLVSVEDPLHEDDWVGWQRLCDAVGDDIQLLGDDLIATDAERLERAIDGGAANAVLVKPNQPGTISRTVDVVERAQSSSFSPVISARSGETCDATVTDLAVGLDAGQIKIGSLARSERLAKYNRLLEIDRDVESGFADEASLGLW